MNNGKSFLRPMASTLLALTFTGGCSHTANKPVPTPKPKPTLVEELDTRLPQGWHRSQQDDYAIYMPPERNITLAIASFPPATLDQEINRATKDMTKILPGFKPKVKGIEKELTKEGLGKVKIYFEPYGDQEYVRLADLIREKAVTHINLASLHFPTYRKRQGQVGALVKPITDRLARLKGPAGRAKPVDIAGKAATIDAYIKRAVTELSIPGLAVGIVQNGKVVFQQAYGVKSLVTKEPITLKTKFAIGSTGKSLTSLLAAKLVDEGKLSWDDKVATQLPDWQGADKPVLRDITLLQSFCACTGYPRRDSTFKFNVHGITALERINEMAAWQPSAGVGELFQYSNHMYAVGGYSAARAYRPALSLEQAYDSALTDLVFKPLGMTASIARLIAPRADAALPHARSASGQFAVIPKQYYQKYNSVAPAGSAWSTLPDMLKFLQFELSKGATVPGYISEQNLLIRRKRRTQMQSDAYYGLGFINEDEDGRIRVGHGGNTSGFTSYFNFFLGDDWGYVILGNYGYFRYFGQLITAKIEYAAYGRKFNGEAYLSQAAKALKRKQREEQDFLPTIRNPRQLIGRYHNPELGSLRIFTKAGTPARILWADIGDYAAELRERPATKGHPRKFEFIPPYASVGVLEYKAGAFVAKGAANTYVFKKTR